MTAVYSLLGAVLTAMLWSIAHLITINRRLARIEFALFGNSTPQVQGNKSIFPICSTLAKLVEEVEGAENANS